MKKIVTKIALLLGFPLILMSLIGGDRVKNKAFSKLLDSLLDHSVPEITISEVEEDSVIFLDARAFAEYQVSHLKNAQHVGYESFNLESVSTISKDAPIVVYCSIGYRSEKVAKKLCNAGFTNVKNLYGGIFEWKNQDKKVFTDSLETQQIHAYSKTWGIWLNKGEKVYK